VSFLDISEAYDNVLIDILCEQMHQAQLPLKIVRVMWNLLWRKEMVFYCKGQSVAESVEFKGLPQGSALSPFSYGFYTSQADRFLPTRCSILQYADNLAIYAAHYDVGNIQRTIQSACASVNDFFPRDLAFNIGV
jgi:hypothetical protein